MKYLSVLIIGIVFISCSNGVEGFRDLKIGSSLEKAKASSICPSPRKNELVTNFDAYDCGEVQIETSKYPIMIFLNDDKVIRIAINLSSGPNKDLALDFYDALSGQYGEASKSKIAFKDEMYPFTVSLSNPIEAESIVSWKNNTVKLWINNNYTALFYESEDFSNILKSINSRTKNL